MHELKILQVKGGMYGVCRTNWKKMLESQCMENQNIECEHNERERS
jgi:hypothetical protein